MALIFLEGFENYGTDVDKMRDGAWSQVNDGANTTSLDTTVVRTGTYSARFGTSIGNAPARRSLRGAKTTVGLAAAFYLDEMNQEKNAVILADFRDRGGSINLTISSQASGAISAVLGTYAGTVIGTTATQPLKGQTWQHIEMLVTFSNTVGSIDIRVDGRQVMSLSGIDNVTDREECAQIALPGRYNAGFAGWPGLEPKVYVDDLIVYDDTGTSNNTIVGDHRVIALRPNGDTGTADWSSGYTAIDDVDSDDDSGYLSAPAGASPSLLTSNFDLEALSGTGEVAGVSAIHRARKTEAGSGTIESGIVQGGSSERGETYQLGTEYVFYEDAFDVDPSSGSAFTVSDVNSLQVQINRTD